MTSIEPIEGTNVTVIHAEAVHAFDVPNPANDGERQAMTKRLIELTIRKRELDAEARKIGEVIDQIEAALLEQWIEAGRQSERLDGYTVYLSPKTWATPKDDNRHAVVEALETLGMADMVTYNTITLSAWFRERKELGEEVPPKLAEVVDLVTKHSLNVRKGRN